MAKQDFAEISQEWDSGPVAKIADDVAGHHPVVGELLAEFMEARPELRSLGKVILETYGVLVECYEGGGTLYLCGNGGSFADCVHIAGELLKSFERDRKIDSVSAQTFDSLPYGKELADNLEGGLPAVALGMSVSLNSAVANDNTLRDIHYAQELFGMCPKSPDIFMGISTSGNSTNVVMAASVARASGIKIISLTGQDGGKLGAVADFAIKAPGTVTKTVQEHHLPIYHVICAMIEAHFWPKMRTH